MVASESTSKRRRMVVLGSLVLVAGIVAAGLLWLSAGSRRSGAVENLARAPIGCDTTLDFASPGEYFIFVETTGRFDEVRGDCDAQGEYDVTDVRPDVNITVIDPDGTQLDLATRRDAVTYSTGDFVGRSVLAVDVAEAGDHVMRVESAEGATFAVAVGRDPNSGVNLLRGAGIAAGLVGLVVGFVLMLFVGKSKQPAAAGWTPAQPGQPQWAPGQPQQPPYGQPGQPPYGQPGQPPQQPPYAQPPGQAQQPGAASAPVYGGYGEAGQYGQTPPAQPQPDPYARPAGPDSTPQVPSPPTAPSPFAPSPEPGVNPFAPPTGVPQQSPSGGVPHIPGQPTPQAPPAPGAATGDGALGWPASDETTPGRTSDDEQTPPSGASPDVDRWNTSRHDPPR